MFSTLLGALPPDPDGPIAVGDHEMARLDDVAALGATGLELVSDGAGPAELDPTAAADDAAEAVVRAWRDAAVAGAMPVKAVLLGPVSGARASGLTAESTAERIRVAILALAAAECPFVEIAEPGALAIATDPAAASAFAAAHRRLVDGSEGVHCSLAMTGGNLDGAAPATFFDLPYASYAFDLIAGPDNWRLIAQAPADRGIVCGAIGLADEADDTRELLIWAAHYAASTNGRGLERVGLANAPTPRGAPQPTRAEVLRRLGIVAEASRLAAVERGEDLARHLDPRAIDARSAALGRFEPARRRRS